MLLKIHIDHEFADVAVFAAFATGYAELCRSLGVTPRSGDVDAAPVSKPISPAIAPAPSITPAPVAAASEEQAPQPDAAPRKRGRPSKAAATESDAPALTGADAPKQEAAAHQSEPAKDVAPNTPAPANAANAAKNEADAAPEAVTLDMVRGALNALIMSGEGGEDEVLAIKAAHFPNQKLPDLDADTRAAVYAALTAKMA